MISSGLNMSMIWDIYEQYKNYIQTNVSLQEMIRAVQFLPEINGFSSFWYTSTCWYKDISRMVPWCFLYVPERNYFNWMSVLLPDWATSSNVSKYDEMQTFVTFLLTHRKFLSEWASIEIVNAVDKSVLNSNWLGKATIATNLWAKMARYGLNITNTTTAETPEDNSYISINMVWDFSWTIDAIQPFIPINDIRIDTWSVQIETDSEWNSEYRTNRAYITIVLWNDYVLWNNLFSWLANNKFSYVLNISPILPLTWDIINK